MGAHELAFYGWKEGAAHRFFGPPNGPDLLDGLAVYDIVRVAPTLGRRETVAIARQVAVG